MYVFVFLIPVSQYCQNLPIPKYNTHYLYCHSIDDFWRENTVNFFIRLPQKDDVVAPAGRRCSPAATGCTRGSSPPGASQCVGTSYAVWRILLCSLSSAHKRLGSYPHGGVRVLVDVSWPCMRAFGNLLSSFSYAGWRILFFLLPSLCALINSHPPPGPFLTPRSVAACSFALYVANSTPPPPLGPLDCSTPPLSPPLPSMDTLCALG